MFNLADIVVIAVIGIGVFLGAWKGLFKMVLSLFSVVIAVIASFFVQPIIFTLLRQYTGLFEKLVGIISEKLDLTAIAAKLINPEVGEKVAGEAGDSLLNVQIMKMLARKVEEGSALQSVQIQISQNLAGIALQIVSFFLGLLLILLAFAILSRLLNLADKLPIIREANKTAGALVGGCVGILLLWVGMLFMNYWFSTGQQLQVMELIESSMIAVYIYRYNLLVYYFILIQ